MCTRRVILSVPLSLCLLAGCSTTAPTRTDGATDREARIREQLWSESTLIRGASPDLETDTIVTASAFGVALATGQPASDIELRLGRSATHAAFANSAEPDPGNFDSASLIAPGCLNFHDDWDRLPCELLDDFESVCSHRNLCILFVAGGLSYVVHETLDDDVADAYERHPNRWGKGQEFFAAIGNPGHHFAAIGSMYLYSLHTQDAEMHSLSKALFNAVAITGLTTMTLKATIGTNTTAPNSEPDPFGGAWPSGHTSSVFAFASVLDEYYGPKIGIPAYLLAGLAGWERIDDGEHDLSDVLFGAVLGIVIGKTVGAKHHAEFCGMQLQPYVDPQTGTSGVSLEHRF